MHLKRVLIWPLSFVRLAVHGEWPEIAYKLHVIFRNLDFGLVPPSELGLPPGPGHVESGGPALERLLRRLSIPPGAAILDIGAGKGAALITLAQFPFARVAGIELNAELAKIARRNFRRLGLDIELHCADAATFEDLQQFNFYYMYNPFHEAVMGSVLGRIREGVEAERRPAYLIYKTPHCHDLLLRNGCRVVQRCPESDTTVYLMDVQSQPNPNSRPEIAG